MDVRERLDQQPADTLVAAVLVGQVAHNTLAAFCREPGLAQQEPSRCVVQRVEVHLVLAWLLQSCFETDEQIRHAFTSASAMLRRLEKLLE
eukprot:1205934-Pyramimonas_sp.AAC.1